MASTRSTSKLFLAALFAIMLLAGLVTFWLAGEAEPEGPSDIVAQDTPIWEGMSAEARKRWIQEAVSKQATAPAQDDPNAPPFEPLFKQNLVTARAHLEKQIAEYSLWHHYERCRAEHASTGKDAKQSHDACIIWYNRALWDQLDLMMRLAEEEGQLASFNRLRFHKDVVYDEVNRILKESDNVIERLMALKVIERGGFIDSGEPFAPEVYRNLEKYTHPEVALILNPQLDVPVEGPEVAENLAHFAAEPRLAVETSNRAAIVLGRSPHAEKLNDVVKEVLETGWEKDMSLMPRGIAMGLGICAKACTPGFEALAARADEPMVSIMLYDSLFAIRDPAEKREMARRIEQLLPPLESLQPWEQEVRTNAFASLYK